MKDYIHARLSPAETTALKSLREITGKRDSELVREGLRSLYRRATKGRRSALELAGTSVGKFLSPLTDLSTDKKYLEGYGR